MTVAPEQVMEAAAIMRQADHAGLLGDRTRLYFVGAGEPVEAIKIGVATDPRKRLSVIQADQHLPVRIMTTVWIYEFEEAQVHRQFAHLRIRGEWFRPAAELLEVIADYVALAEAEAR
jgi:hypothetical protein